MKMHALLWAGLLLFVSPASAQPQYPDRPVRIVVGNAPGGGTDIAARLIAQKLSQNWGQSVIVENKPGASGTIGADLVAKAAPDGYTLLLSPQTSTAIAAATTRSLPYDVIKDFTPISVVGSVPTVLVAGPALPAGDFPAFVRYAKQHGQTLSFGSGGQASTQHLAGEMLNLALGTRMQHVPYKGENPGIVDVIGGQLPLMFVTLSTALPHLRTGKVRALGLASLSRSSAAPDIPTIAESGLPGFEMAPWYGLFAPAGLPPAVTARIHADLVKVLAQPDVKDQFARNGFELVGNTPAEAAAYLQSELAKYRQLVKDASIESQ